MYNVADIHDNMSSNYAHIQYIAQCWVVVYAFSRKISWTCPDEMLGSHMNEKVWKNVMQWNPVQDTLARIT